MTSDVNQEVTDALVKSLRAMSPKNDADGGNRAATSWPNRARRPLTPNGPAFRPGGQCLRWSGDPAPLATQGAALVIVTAAPDAVVLVRLQREGQAFGPDRAGGADHPVLLPHAGSVPG